MSDFQGGGTSRVNYSRERQEQRGLDETVPSYLLDADRELLSAQPSSGEAATNSNSGSEGDYDRPAGEDDSRRARRILANRRSAQRSRTRKMQYVVDIERKVDKMKAESEAMAQNLVQLRNQHQELVSTKSDLKNRVAMLMQKSQQREAVCCTLQYEIAQLRSQLTGTSFGPVQPTMPGAPGSGPIPGGGAPSVNQGTPLGRNPVNPIQSNEGGAPSPSLVHRQTPDKTVASEDSVRSIDKASGHFVGSQGILPSSSHRGGGGGTPPGRNGSEMTPSFPPGVNGPSPRMDMCPTPHEQAVSYASPGQAYAPGSVNTANGIQSVQEPSPNQVQQVAHYGNIAQPSFPPQYDMSAGVQYPPQGNPAHATQAHNLDPDRYYNCWSWMPEHHEQTEATEELLAEVMGQNTVPLTDLFSDALDSLVAGENPQGQEGAGLMYGGGVGMHQGSHLSQAGLGNQTPQVNPMHSWTHKSGDSGGLGTGGSSVSPGDMIGSTPPM